MIGNIFNPGIGSFEAGKDGGVELGRGMGRIGWMVWVFRDEGGRVWEG